MWQTIRRRWHSNRPLEIYRKSFKTISTDVYLVKKERRVKFQSSNSNPSSINLIIKTLSTLLNIYKLFLKLQTPEMKITRKLN